MKWPLAILLLAIATTSSLDRLVDRVLLASTDCCAGESVPHEDDDGCPEGCDPAACGCACCPSRVPLVRVAVSAIDFTPAVAELSYPPIAGLSVERASRRVFHPPKITGLSRS